MKVHSLVFAAALLAFSQGKPVTHNPVPSGLINNSTNVFDHDVPRYLSFHEGSTGSLSTAQPRRHDKRHRRKGASDDVWYHYVIKGGTLVEQMFYSDYDAAQLYPEPKTTAKSPYSVHTLRQWGYAMYSVDDFAYRDFGPVEENLGEENPGKEKPSKEKLWGISPFLQRHGFSTMCIEEGGQWRAALITHWTREKSEWETLAKQQYRGPDGITRPATGGFFYMSVLPNGGIMAQNRLSPWEALQTLHKNAVPTDLPAMQKSSDMMWAMWEFFVPIQQQQSIKFFITLAIENKTTLSLIRRALDTEGETLKPEGVEISMKTEAGRALLASPNGAGFAYFLIEHKAEIGFKAIDYVIVMECEDQKPSACLVFVVKELHWPRPKWLWRTKESTQWKATP